MSSRVEHGGVSSPTTRRSFTTNYVLVETLALAQARLGLDAVRALDTDVVPVLQVVWVDDALHRAALTALVTAQRRDAAGGEYPAVADTLVAAGADIRAAGNGAGLTLVTMAQGNPAMQEALRRHGAV